MIEPAGADAVALVEAFRTAQNRGDVEGCLGLLGDAAVFDIGTGRFEGPPRIATLLRLLARIHYTTEGEPGPGRPRPAERALDGAARRPAPKPPR